MIGILLYGSDQNDAECRGILFLILAKPYGTSLLGSARFCNCLISRNKRNKTDGYVKEGVGYHKIINPKGQQNMENDESEEDDDTLERVPSAHVSIVLLETVTIRDKYKNIWQVKTRKVDGHWYLLDGWAKFVADSCVSVMDMLVFNYSGPGSLDVNIHGSDGNIKGVGYRKIDDREENLNMESDESEDVERVLYGQNKKLDHNNGIKSKGKMGKEAFKYQDETDEYETDDDFTHDRGQGYWDGEGDDESEESDGFELVCWQNNKCKEMAKELQISKNDNNASGSRKPQQKKNQKKRNVDCLSKGNLNSGLASKLNRSYSVKRMKPLFRNGSNKGKRICHYISEDKEEDDSEHESIEPTSRNDWKGKGRVEKELRAGVRTSGSENPYQKRRNVDDLCGDKHITSRSALRPKIPSSAANMPPRRMNERDNKGKGILNELSERESDSDYVPYDSYDEISEEDSRSRINGIENAKKLMSKARDVKTSKSKSRKNAKLDYFGKELIDSGVLPRPKGNYFVTKMKPTRTNEVYIPRDIYMDENLYIPKKIRLVDPDGEIYPAMLKVRKDGRLFYAGGWNELCRTNHISPDDYCILEFGEGDMQRYLFASFVRVGK